jgi:hypothetical protein
MLYSNVLGRGSRGNSSLKRKWLIVKEEVSHTRIINCANAIELRDTGKYLHKLRCK